MDYLREKGLAEMTEFKATFCSERCKKGPVICINGTVIEHCTFDLAVAEITKALAK